MSAIFASLYRKTNPFEPKICIDKAEYLSAVIAFFFFKFIDKKKLITNTCYFNYEK